MGAETQWYLYLGQSWLFLEPTRDGAPRPRAREERNFRTESFLPDAGPHHICYAPGPPMRINITLCGFKKPCLLGPMPQSLSMVGSEARRACLETQRTRLPG